MRLQAELDGFYADSAKADKFIELVKRHTDFSELTLQMIAEYIEKIVVHEADKSSGERNQQVDVYLNFIGKFEVPAPESTAEEIEAEEKASPLLRRLLIVRVRKSQTSVTEKSTTTPARAFTVSCGRSNVNSNPNGRRIWIDEKCPTVTMRLLPLGKVYLDNLERLDVERWARWLVILVACILSIKYLLFQLACLLSL